MDLNNLVSAVTVTLPGWALPAGALAFVVLLILILRPRGESGGVTMLAQLAVVAVVAGAGYFGLKQFEDNSRFVERKAIEDRAATLLSQANQPGSVLGCLTVAVTPALDEACEKTIFAEPQRVASAIGITADRIALLSDATSYSVREPSFLDRFDHLRKSLEADPYGLVAHILATEHKCLPDSCPRFRILKDADKIKSNLTSRKFDGLLEKYKASWVKIGPGMLVTDMHAMPPLRTLGTKPDENELPSWDSLTKMQTPNGQMSNTPPILPPAQQQTQQPAPQQPIANTNQQPSSTPVSLPQNQQQTPVNNAKQKAAPAQQKQSPVQARKKGGPPEPVGGLPRVTARGSQNPSADADDDDDTPTATPAPPPPQQNRSPFGIFNR
jgi:hypothetical protein